MASPQTTSRLAPRATNTRQPRNRTASRTRHCRYGAQIFASTAGGCLPRCHLLEAQLSSLNAHLTLIEDEITPDSIGAQRSDLSLPEMGFLPPHLPDSPGALSHKPEMGSHNSSHRESCSGPLASRSPSMRGRGPLSLQSNYVGHSGPLALHEAPAFETLQGCADSRSRKTHLSGNLSLESHSIRSQ